MKTGIANLPLHYGRAPKWLFNRMVKLARPISQIIIEEYGQDEFLKRLSNPYFFQCYANILGYDWHSSGTTPVLCAVIKEAKLEDLGIVVAGGKGKTSKKTPEQIEQLSNKFNLTDNKIKQLVYSSKIAAKVDNNMLQDSYNLYHHSFFLSEKGKWAVVQQGMQQTGQYARRYHWLSNDVKSYIEEPDSAICSKKEKNVLDLTSRKSKETREISVDLVKENPIKLKKYQNNKLISKLLTKGQKTLSEFSQNYQILKLPSRHEILKIDLGNFKALEKAYQFQPKTYEELLMLKGMGGKTIRALALISSLVYGSEISWKDPAKFSYCVGGKDGIPYPVNLERYSECIKFLADSIKQSEIGSKDKIHAIKRLKNFIS